MRAYELITESLKTLFVKDIQIRIDMDHLINRMAQRGLFDRYKDIDQMLRELPTLLPQIEEIEPGHQFWVWDQQRRIGLGFRKVNSIPVLTLKTAISSPPKGDRNPTIIMGSVSESASGYIPSKKQANDPRFKTGLTVDVKPDSIQKNAKAFGFKTTRAGIPPLLRK
jgi:hypothetical protein